ncbi:MAG: zinc metallopeptidase [Caldilineaceae bacterium]|nr:zinc metallopeptidase [Caldilineaceae bacterium]MCY4090773.1 zinc metallopeptidase [Caldilineaceae bacterium]MCY4118486.1 zinc metallopeptidase [Caldilineaceae bacterium]MDE0070624.1 zinc metallopeptidase [Caldilineaceae bacterium]MDE0181486.1 zinc metallopeptidase [Caldilineaceae bacterium]
MFFFDPLYIIISLPALALGLWAQMKVKSAFNKYSRVPAGRGTSGAQVARRILDANGLGHVNVEETRGFLSDHYDPRSRTLRLSPQVYQSNSVAAVGVAAHEAGHALQHSTNYAPLTLRSAIVPGVQIGSWLGPIIFIIGMFLGPGLGFTVSLLGLILFAAVAVFTLVTLPVEFNASTRAKEVLVAQGFVGQQELQGVNAVLNAAALTYVAAAIQAITTLLYYAFILFARRD